MADIKIYGKLVANTADQTVADASSIQSGEQKLNTVISNINSRLDNLTAIGRYLAEWNCTTGLPTTNPDTLPYAYKTGDYYIIGTVGSANNKMPSGSIYTGAASSVSAPDGTLLNDYFVFDGSNWSLLPSTRKTITMDSVAGLNDALSAKANTSAIPTTTSQLTNNSGYITSSSIANMVTTDTTQTISGAKTLSNILTINPSGYDDYSYVLSFDTGINANHRPALRGNWGFLECNSNFTPYESKDGLKSLGSDAQRWKDLYLSGNISDGTTTNTISVADIVAKSVVSGVNDGTNWTSLTINGTTKGLAGGSGSGTVTSISTGTGLTGGTITTSGTIAVDTAAIQTTANKTTSITSSSTDTQYPSAKAVYDSVQVAIEKAEGKCNTFVISHAKAAITSSDFSSLTTKYYRPDGTQITSYADFQTFVGGSTQTIYNQYFNSQQAEISRGIAVGDYLVVQKDNTGLNFTIYKKATLGGFENLGKTGDNIYVVETDVPDRWINKGALTDTFLMLETKSYPTGVQYSNASGVLQANPMRVVKLSQVEYAALTTKDSDTFYIIVG